MGREIFKANSYFSQLGIQIDFFQGGGLKTLYGRMRSRPALGYLFPSGGLLPERRLS